MRKDETQTSPRPPGGLQTLAGAESKLTMLSMFVHVAEPTTEKVERNLWMWQYTEYSIKIAIVQLHALASKMQDSSKRMI